jgi:hypothetical protein
LFLADNIIPIAFLSGIYDTITAERLLAIVAAVATTTAAFACCGRCGIAITDHVAAIAALATVAFAAGTIGLAVNRYVCPFLQAIRQQTQVLVVAAAGAVQHAAYKTHRHHQYCCFQNTSHTLPPFLSLNSHFLKDSNHLSGSSFFCILHAIIGSMDIVLEYHGVTIFSVV